MKWYMLILEMSVTFWRQRGNGAIEVSFESRTAQMSHIHVRLLPCVISVFALPTLSSPSSAVLHKFPMVTASPPPSKEAMLVLTKYTRDRQTAREPIRVLKSANTIVSEWVSDTIPTIPITRGLLRNIHELKMLMKTKCIKLLYANAFLKR